MRRTTCWRAYRFARSCEQLAVRTKLQRPQRRTVRGDDADRSAVDLDQLHLTCRPSWEGKRLRSQTAQTQSILRRLERG